MSLPVAYCQQDYMDQLGHCPGIYIRDYGCYVTAASMVAEKFGHAIDPPRMNEAWMDGYVNGCDATDQLLVRTFPDITHEGSPWGRDVLFGLDHERQSALVQIDGTQTLGYITHYLAFSHVQDGRIMCNDPWVGDLCDVEARYGYVVQKVAIYSGVPASLAPAVNYYQGVGEMGSLVQLTCPQAPYRVDVVVVKPDGHVWGTYSDGGAGGLSGAEGQGYSDWGTAGEDGFTSVSARWDDQGRLCLIAVDQIGDAYQAVVRTDGVWDMGWTRIASGVLVD